MRSIDCPATSHTIDLKRLTLIDLCDGLACYIHITQPLQTIGPKQLLTIGRPDCLVVIGVGVVCYLLRFAFSVLRANV